MPYSRWRNEVSYLWVQREWVSGCSNSWSKQRGMKYARNPNPVGRADEAGQFIRDKFREGHNVVLRSPVWVHKKKKKKSDALPQKLVLQWMRASGKLACIHVRHWSYKVCKSRDVLGLHVASIPVEAKKDWARQRKKQRAEGRACAKSWAWGSIVSTGAKRQEIAVVGAEWASIRVVEMLLTTATMLV